METTSGVFITVQTTVAVPVEKAWKIWNEPEHITQWYHASDDWHAPYAKNDLRKGGRLTITMAARDGSVSFDFEGIYTAVQEFKLIEITLLDDRKVRVTFSGDGRSTRVTEEFEPETENTRELQRFGWQAILDNFAKHAEQA